MYIRHCLQRGASGEVIPDKKAPKEDPALTFADGPKRQVPQLRPQEVFATSANFPQQQPYNTPVTSIMVANNDSDSMNISGPRDGSDHDVLSEETMDDPSESTDHDDIVSVIL